MRRVGALALIAVVGLALCAVASKPVVQAHGELWTELHIAGQWFDIQFAFNVQDHGEEGDRGTISLRIFDHWTGKLVAVGVSTSVFDVYQDDAYVYFSAVMRVVRLDEEYYVPLHYPWFPFWALDGEDVPDEFGMFGTTLLVHHGKVTAK